MSDAVLSVAGVAPASVDAPLMESGLDSLGSVELRNSLASRFNVELPATATIDYPTVAALARFIASQLAPVRKVRRPRRRLAAPAAAEQLIDIVGVSCVYPGGRLTAALLLLRTGILQISCPCSEICGEEHPTEYNSV